MIEGIARSALGVGTVFISIALGSAALAQEPVRPIEPIEPNKIQSDVSGVASGTVRATRTLGFEIKLGALSIRPAVAVGTGLETVVSAREELALRAGLFVDGGPRLDLVLEADERNTLSAGARATYRYYTGSNQQNFWDLTANAGYRYAGDRFTATLTGVGTRRWASNLDLILQGGDAQVSDFDRRVRTDQITYGGAFRVDITRRTFIDVQGTVGETKFDENATLNDESVASALDRTDYNLRLGVGRRLTPRTDLILSFDTTRSSFHDVESFRDYWTQRGQVTVQFAPTTRLDGSVGVGVRQLSPDRERLETFTGLVANGRLAFEAAERLRLNLYATRDTNPTIWRGNLYSVAEGGGLGATYLLSRTVSLGGQVYVSQIKYPEAVPISNDPGAPLLKRRDDIVTYSGNLGFELFNQPITLTAGYFTRSSNFDTQSTRGLLLNVSLAVSRSF